MPALVIHKGLGARHAHPAAAHTGVQKLIDIGVALGQDVLAHQAHICRAVLHINGNVAGLDQEIPDLGVGVFHHQFAAVGVVAGAVARTGQQSVRLVAQAALGQRDVQPGTALPHTDRGQRCGQTVQFVQIEGKADGPCPGVKRRISRSYWPPLSTARAAPDR